MLTRMVDVDRLKKDGKTKYVKLLGKGIILTLVDHLFWNLPFCSAKQSQAVRKKAGVTEEDRSTKWEEIVAEHDLPGASAREQLASGWKEYLDMRAGGRPAVLALRGRLASPLWSWTRRRGLQPWPRGVL